MFSNCNKSLRRQKKKMDDVEPDPEGSEKDNSLVSEIADQAFIQTMSIRVFTRYL